MKPNKRKKLENAGWKVGSVSDFLGLSPDESAYIEMKLALGDSLRTLRTKKKLTQVELAQLLESSQSRIAKMEAADPSVTLDLLVRSLLAVGASKRQVASALTTSL